MPKRLPREKEAVAKPASFASFFTRKAANEGVTLPLSLPTGEPTEYWLRIRGLDSDAYRTAVSEMQSRAFEAAESKDKKTDVAHETLLLLVSLVAGWNLPEEFTPDNVATFLKEAPQIAQQINKLSAKRSLFFAQSLKPSESLPVPTSS